MEPSPGDPVDPTNFIWSFELTLRFRAHDYQIKFQPTDPSPDCPLFDPPQQEDDQQDSHYDLGAWFIHREAGFPNLEVVPNGLENGHSPPLRVLPKEGQLEIKIACRTPEKEFTVLCLPYAPYQLNPSLLKRPSKPGKTLRQKERNAKSLDGFYHVDRERNESDHIVMLLKHGAIKGLRFFIPDDRLPPPFREYWCQKYPNRVQRRIRFSPNSQTVVFYGEESPSSIQKGLLPAIDIPSPKIQIAKRSRKKQDVKIEEQEPVDIETTTEDPAAPLGSPSGDLKPSIRTPSENFKIIPFDPKNKTYQSIIEKNTQQNSTAPTIQIDGEHLTLDKLSVFQMKDELKKRGEAATGVRSNLAHRLRICLINESPHCAEPKEGVLAIDTVPKDLIVTGDYVPCSTTDTESESSESGTHKKKKPKKEKKSSDKQKKGKKVKKKRKAEKTPIKKEKTDKEAPGEQSADNESSKKKRSRQAATQSQGPRHTKKRKTGAEKECRIHLGESKGASEEPGAIAGEGPSELQGERHDSSSQSDVATMVKALQDSLRELTEKNIATEQRNMTLRHRCDELKAKMDYLEMQNETREKQNQRLEAQIENVSVLLQDLTQKLQDFANPREDSQLKTQ